MPLANRANERPFTLGSYLYGFTPFDKKDSLFKAIELVDSIENGDASAFANYKYTDGNSPNVDESFFGHFRIVESNGEVDEIRINNVDLLNKDNSQEIFNFINTGANTSILFKNNSNQNIGFFKVNNAVFENNYTIIKVDQVIYLGNFTNEQEYSFDLNFIKKSNSEIVSFPITVDSKSALITEFNNSSKFYLENPANTLVEANFSTPSGVTPSESNSKIYQLITKTQNQNNDLFEGDFGFESQQIQSENLKLIKGLSIDIDTDFDVNSEKPLTNKKITETFNILAPPPNYNSPSVGISSSESGNYEVGTSLSPEVSPVFNQGDAGNATLFEIYKNGSLLQSQSSDFTQTDNIVVSNGNTSYQAKVTYNDGVIKNNPDLGFADDRGQIIAGSKTSGNKTINGVKPQWKGQKNNNTSMSGSTYAQFNTQLSKTISSINSITVNEGNYGFLILKDSNATIKDPNGFPLTEGSGYTKNPINNVFLADANTVNMTEYIISSAQGNFTYSIE